MLITIKNVELAKDSLSVGDYVATNGLFAGGTIHIPRSVDPVVGEVIAKSNYVFVVRLINTQSGNIRVAFNYVDLLLDCGLSVISEDEALIIASEFRRKRYCLSEVA